MPLEPGMTGPVRLQPPSTGLASSVEAPGLPLVPGLPLTPELGAPELVGAPAAAVGAPPGGFVEPPVLAPP